MNRCFALVCALFLAFVTVSTAGFAAPSQWIRFTLDGGSDERINGTFRDDLRRRGSENWSTGFKPSELIGLDVGGLRSGGLRPLRFAVVREAGRLDCVGRGASSRASGQCRFTENADFGRVLADHRIGMPTRNQAFALMAIDARRALVDALGAAHSPIPTINQLIALTALGADDAFVSSLSRTKFRIATIDSLIEFKALGVSPEYIAGFQRLGYHLSADQLVEFKALGITADFVRSVRTPGAAVPPASSLVNLKLFGRRR